MWGVLFLIGVLGMAAAATMNDRPVIGILSQPVEPIVERFGTSYIAASYVKYLESGGARVVPIPFTLPYQAMEQLLAQLNGVLLPGGGSDMSVPSPYRTAVETVWAYVTKANAAGDYFPLWGTCQGFEQIAVLAAGNVSVLSRFDAENISLPLTAVAAGRMYAHAPAVVETLLTTLPVTMNNHQWGVSPADFEAYHLDTAGYRVLTTSEDRGGNLFVSSMEHQKMPIFGSQFHPEKPSFEWWSAEAINHSAEAVEANRWFNFFFVNQCRLNLHRFSSSGSLEKQLIYNVAPVYTFSMIHDFEQMYFFQ
jgi:gamma-glutamyl hydrolase